MLLKLGESVKTRHEEFLSVHTNAFGNLFLWVVLRLGGFRLSNTPQSAIDNFHVGAHPCRRNGCLNSSTARELEAKNKEVHTGCSQIEGVSTTCLFGSVHCEFKRTRPRPDKPRLTALCRTLPNFDLDIARCL